MNASRDNIPPEDKESPILKQRLNSIESLSSPIFHDLNNVFGTVLGLSELLELKLGDNNPYRDLFKTTIQAVHRATGFTKQLNLFLKENSPTEEGPTNLKEELDGMLLLLQPYFRCKTEIEHETSPQILPIKISAKKLRDIIAGVAVYVYQTTPDTDAVLRITLESQPDETQFISFTVISNSPFTESDSQPPASSEVIDSRALLPSLYPSRILVEGSNGQFEVFPDPNGTCIRISLPVI